MAASTNDTRESNTNASRRVLIDVEDYADYMPKYTGVQDPIAANMWIVTMEQFFVRIECADDDKVAYAVSILRRSGAKTWWNKIKGTSGPTKMTWNRFKEVFKEEFSPLRMEMKLVEEHVTLKCRNGRLREYTSRFEELWWFYWWCLTPEKRLIYHYVKGLPANIKDFIPDKDLTSWDKMFAAVLLIHEENNRRLEEMNALNKKKRKVRKQKV